MWQKIKDWFKDSTTIAWGRFQILLGALWGVLVSTDLSPVLSQKWLTAWFILSGTITEMLRRRTL